MKPFFDIQHLRLGYGDREVLQDVGLQFTAGEFVCIAGPNGAGKSTLLNVMAGLRTRYSGLCAMLGKEVRDWHRRDYARTVAMVAQGFEAEFAFTAEQVVTMGRTPFADGLFESDADRQHVQTAMERTGTLEFRHRNFRHLSGGERQRVVLASALAQAPRALLLDEPTTYLDIEHQVGLCRLLRDLCNEGLLVVAATHDLNLAAAYATRMILLQDGKVWADGSPVAVLNEANLRSVFHVSATVVPAHDGRPWARYGV